MKKTPLSKQGTRASRAWVWPLAACALVCSPEVLQAVPLATGIELQAPVSATISKAEKINPTTVELTYADGKVATRAGPGFYTKVDLGIVKYHFELGAGKENFEWE